MNTAYCLQLSGHFHQQVQSLRHPGAQAQPPASDVDILTLRRCVSRLKLLSLAPTSYEHLNIYNEAGATGAWRLRTKPFEASNVWSCGARGARGPQESEFVGHSAGGPSLGHLPVLQHHHNLRIPLHGPQPERLSGAMPPKGAKRLPWLLLLGAPASPEASQRCAWLEAPTAQGLGSWGFGMLTVVCGKAAYAWQLVQSQMFNMWMTAVRAYDGFASLGYRRTAACSFLAQTQFLYLLE